MSSEHVWHSFFLRIRSGSNLKISKSYDLKKKKMRTCSVAVIKKKNIPLEVGMWSGRNECKTSHIDLKIILESGRGEVDEHQRGWRTVTTVVATGHHPWAKERRLSLMIIFPLLRWSDAISYQKWRIKTAGARIRQSGVNEAKEEFFLYSPLLPQTISCCLIKNHHRHPHQNDYLKLPIKHQEEKPLNMTNSGYTLLRKKRMMSIFTWVKGRKIEKSEGGRNE